MHQPLVRSDLLLRAACLVFWSASLLATDGLIASEQDRDVPHDGIEADSHDGIEADDGMTASVDSTHEVPQTDDASRCTPRIPGTQSLTHTLCSQCYARDMLHIIACMRSMHNRHPTNIHACGIVFCLQAG